MKTRIRTMAAAIYRRLLPSSPAQASSASPNEGTRLIQTIDRAETLFPKLTDKPIALDRLEWKWGDIYNDTELVFLCQLAAAGYAPIFEFGTFRGRTTYNLALNVAEGERIHTIDIGRPLEVDAESNIEHHRYMEYVVGEVFAASPPAIRNKIIAHTGDSTKFDFSPYEGMMGMVLVDGGHSYEVCRQDSQAALRLVKPGGVIVWDDYVSYWPGVQQALNELALHEKLYFLSRPHLVVHLAS